MSEGGATARRSLGSEAPERKRRKRLRKGIRDKQVGLNQDLLAQIAPYVAGASAKSLLLLSMTNKFLHHHIMENSHGIWRRLYAEWESKRQRNTRVITVPNAFPFHPWPFGRPMNDDWKDQSMGEQRRVFDRYAHKVMVLTHIGRCGICGTTRGNHQAYWSLNMRVCKFCWWNNTISNRWVVCWFDLIKTANK